MSSLTSKSGPPQITNTTQNAAPPPYVAAAQQNLITTGSNLTSPFTSYAPADMVAGINPDQQMGFDLARQTAYNAYNTPTNYADPLSPTANFATPTVAQATAAQAPNTTLGPAAQAANTTVGSPAWATAYQFATPPQYASTAQADFKPGTAEQLGAGEIQPFLNPYLQNVLDPTLANMRRQNDETLAQTRARSAAAGAFGGSRGALMEAQQNRAFGEQVATTAAQLMAQGYDKATATAMANAQMRQQTALQNTQIGNQVGMFNAGQSNDISKFNTGQANNIGMFNVGQQNQIGMYNAGVSNDLTKYQAGLNQQTGMYNAGQTNDLAKYGAGLNQQLGMYNTGQQNQTELQNAQMQNALAQAFGLNYNNLLDSEATRGLATAATNNTLANDEQRRQLAALQQMLQTGDYQRQVEQAGINSPFTALQSLVGSTPGMNAVGTTTQGATATPTQSNPLATLLGVGMLGKTLLSDERSKTDVQKLGTDPQTGIEMAAYRYKGDPKSYPKVVGPASAQQVERVMPGATKDIGGKKVIKGGALQTMLGGNV